MSNFVIKQLLFCPTGTYNDQFLRSFYLGDNVDTQKLSMMQELTRNGKVINAGVLSGIGGQILKPSADLTHQVQIANGFGEQRLRFMMEVHSRAMGADLITYVTGYTNYPGYHRVDSLNVVFDPNMKLYFDKTVSVQHVSNGVGGFRSSVIDSSHLLFGEYNPSFNAGQESVAMSIRPEDIFSVLEISSQTGGDYYSDGRLVFADLMPKKSSLTNEMPGHYAAKVLSNYRDSVVNGMGGMGTMPDAMQYAIGNVAEGVINEDPLFHAICRTLNFAEDGSITYGALCTVSPGLDTVAALTGGESKYVHALHQRGTSADWNASNMETLAATAMAIQVPAIMADLLLTGIAFIATNDTFGGEYDVQVKNYQAFAKFDMTSYIQTFQQRLITSVLQSLSQNRQVKFHITAMIDMHGETRINVSMQGGHMYEYCNPTFASALFAPVMSYNKEQVFGLVKDFEQIARNLDVKHSVDTSQPMQHAQHQPQSNMIVTPQQGSSLFTPWESSI